MLFMVKALFTLYSARPLHDCVHDCVKEAGLSFGLLNSLKTKYMSMSHLLTHTHTHTHTCRNMDAFPGSEIPNKLCMHTHMLKQRDAFRYLVLPKLRVRMNIHTGILTNKHTGVHISIYICTHTHMLDSGEWVWILSPWRTSVRVCKTRSQIQAC
jgi:hypothetical protein